MDLVSLIDIRKIVLSGHQNVVKNLEEYERLNFSLQKRKEDNFVNAKNANSSSSSIEENIEIYEEDNEDDDEPIEALIRGKRGFSHDEDSPVPESKRRSTSIEPVEIADSDDEEEAIESVEIKSELIEEIPKELSPTKTVPRVLTTINGQKVGGPIKILNQATLNGLKGPLRIVKPGQILKGGQVIRPGQVLKPGQIIRQGQMLNGKMIKVLGRPGAQNGNTLKIMNGQGMKIIRPSGQFIQKPTENGQNPVQVVQKPMKFMRAVQNTNPAANQQVPQISRLPTMQKPIQGHPQFRPVLNSSAPGKPVRFTGDLSKLTTVRLANGKLAKVLTLPKDSQQAKMMTKIGKPVLENSNFSPPPKLQMSPVQAIRPSPASSPTNSETCEVMVKDEPEEEFGMDTVTVNTDEMSNQNNLSGVEPIERDDGFDFYCPEQNAPYTNSDGEDLDPFNLRGFPPKKRRTYVAKHECKICNKKFVRPAELQRHQRIHTGHKPYKCDICNHAFIRKDHLTSHMISHSEQTYNCTQCNFRTARVDSFRRHVRRHEIDSVLPGGAYEDDEDFQEAEKEYQLQAMALPSIMSKTAFQPRSSSGIDMENNDSYMEDEDTVVINAAST